MVPPSRTALVALTLALGMTPPVAHGQAPPSPEPEAPRTRLVLLGTGTPNADPERSGPSLAIVVDGASYLVDAGPGIVRRAAAAAARHGLPALGPANLSTVFLTHLHSDHTVGLPDVFLTAWTLERDRPLVVIGPPGTEQMADHIRQAWSADIDNRVNGLEPANDGGHRMDARDAEPGMVFEDERVRVIAFAVPHGSWEPGRAFGYRFETPDRTIVISGDTGPSDAVVEACSGCDILVHEVYAKSGWDRREPAWQRYHAASHTSGLELGELAARARPGLLVLTHQLLWGATPEELLAEVRAGFAGRVVYGNDLDVF